MLPPSADIALMLNDAGRALGFGMVTYVPGDSVTADAVCKAEEMAVGIEMAAVPSSEADEELARIVSSDEFDGSSRISSSGPSSPNASTASTAPTTPGSMTSSTANGSFSLGMNLPMVAARLHSWAADPYHWLGPFVPELFYTPTTWDDKKKQDWDKAGLAGRIKFTMTGNMNDKVIAVRIIASPEKGISAFRFPIEPRRFSNAVLAFDTKGQMCLDWYREFARHRSADRYNINIPLSPNKSGKKTLNIDANVAWADQIRVPNELVVMRQLGQMWDCPIQFGIFRLEEVLKIINNHYDRHSEQQDEEEDETSLNPQSKLDRIKMSINDARDGQEMRKRVALVNYGRAWSQHVQAW